MLARRSLLQAAFAAPLAAAGAVAAGRRLAGVAGLARPGATGTSTTRCARCGDPGHTMLDPACPAERRVLA